MSLLTCKTCIKKVKILITIYLVKNKINQKYSYKNINNRVMNVESFTIHLHVSREGQDSISLVPVDPAQYYYYIILAVLELTLNAV